MTEVALTVTGVSKRFDGRAVLSDVTFELEAGECVAICGENGAGKTTLLRIVTGLETADGGSVSVSGGLGLVHQHFSLVPALSVAENVFLGAEPRRAGVFFDQKRARAETLALAKRAGLEVDVSATVENLTVGERQKVELLKALRTAGNVLLLDEPTAVLGPREIDGFLTLVEQLKKSGLAVVFVSHKLHEVARIADRALVLRQGKIVLEARPQDTPLSAIADAMIGEQTPIARSARSSAPGADVAHLTKASCGAGRDRIEDLELELKAGTITGIAGVEGNGQHGLFSLLTGRLPVESGSFAIGGAAVRSCAEARAAGVRAVPADRHADAMLPGHDVRDHLRLGHHVADPNVLARFDVRPADPDFDALALSGGNQQKLIFARELGAQTAPRLLVVHEPTRGVDFLAKERLWAEIERARDAGAAVVVLSSDLDELRAISDRILVLFRGKVVFETPVTAATDDKLAAAMAGIV